VTRHSQRLRTTSLPFRYEPEGLDFTLDSYTVNGGPSVDISLAPSQRTVDLTSEDGWDWIILHGRIDIDERTVKRVFPEPERSNPPANLYVAKQCHKTILRDRTDVSTGHTPPPEYDVKIRLDRSELRGEVILRPFLVRSSGNDRDGPYASVPNARVASGDIYYVRVNGSATEEMGLIDGEEIAFSTAEHLPDEERLYHLDLRNEARPKLWLNADHPRITEVLASEGSVGTEPRLRDVILDQIQYGVWTQLMYHAAAAVDDRGDVEHDWQRTVIESFAPQMYDVGDTEEAALKLKEELEDPSGVARLAGLIDGELQEYVDPRTQLVKLMEEGLEI
jgi:hypothetical protein